MFEASIIRPFPEQSEILPANSLSSVTRALQFALVLSPKTAKPVIDGLNNGFARKSPPTRTEATKRTTKTSTLPLFEQISTLELKVIIWVYKAFLGFRHRKKAI